MNIKCQLLFVSCILIITGINPIYSQTPGMMNYQAVLTDTNGDIVADGTYSITFKLYDTNTGGVYLWSETQSVSIQDGLMNVLLGDINEITGLSGSDLWLGITVGNDSDMTPRKRITTLYSYPIFENTYLDSLVLTAVIWNQVIGFNLSLPSEMNVQIQAITHSPGDEIYLQLVIYDEFGTYLSQGMVNGFSSILTSGGGVNEATFSTQMISVLPKGLYIIYLWSFLTSSTNQVIYDISLSAMGFDSRSNNSVNVNRFDLEPPTQIPEIQNITK